MPSDNSSRAGPTGPAGRAGRTYAFAAGYTDTFIGTLDNFVRPLRSDVHGAFGGSYLLTVGALLPLLRRRGERLPRVIWLLWGGALLAFLHLQGARTPVHWLAWAGLPGGGFMRIPGRLALLLPLPLLLGVVWASTRWRRFQGAVRMLWPWVSSLWVRMPICAERSGSTRPSRAARRNMEPWSRRSPSSSQVSEWASK